MKTRITALVLAITLLSAAAWAGSNVTLAWDANIEPDLVGYKMYISSESGQFTDPPVATITAPATTVTVMNLPDGTWYFVVTAYDSTQESGYSNQVGDTFDAPPDNPKGLTITGVVSFTFTVNQ